MMLIRTYPRARAPRANLDPLGLHERECRRTSPPNSTASIPRAAARSILGGALGFETATVAEIVDTLRANYCGHVGLEYMHINDLAERRFLQERMEGKGARITFTPRASRRSWPR
jgi:2-oxoglutarate dehydrogenase E1 component